MLFVERESAAVTLNCIGDGVVSTDEAGKITFLNFVAEQMLGWARQEAAGRDLAEVVLILDATTRERTQSPLSFDRSQAQRCTCRRIGS